MYLLSFVDIVEQPVLWYVIVVGLSKAANEEHGRDLPVMNGIKEDIKSIGVLDLGSPVYQEALLNLSNRLKKLKVRSVVSKFNWSSSTSVKDFATLCSLILFPLT